MRTINTWIFVLIIACLGAVLLYRQLPHPGKMRKSEQRTIELAALPDGFRGYGIDVSRYQGRIDWELLHQKMGDSLGFVYFKVSEGKELQDPLWQKNHAALQQLKIPNGAYHFFIPGLDPVKQADNFLSHYRVTQNDLPPVIDVELELRDEQKFVQEITTWLTIVEKRTGRRPIIYTSYDLYATKLKSAFETYYFWVANYADREDRFQDSTILIWQYTDEGELPGIEGKVDLNFSRLTYR